MPSFFARSVCCSSVVRQELVERRIEETDRRREAFERLEDAGEVFALIRQQLRERRFAVVDVVGENHLAHGVDAVAFEEHVLGAGRPMPAAPNAIAFSVCSGLSALVRTSRRVTFEHQFMSWLKLLNFSVFCAALSPCSMPVMISRRRGLELAGVDRAGGAVDGKEVAFLEGLAVDRDGLLVVIDLAAPLAPQTQTLPIWRATSAACEVTPPLAVRMPSAAIMPRRSSGEVSLRTSRTFSPFSAAAAARSALR